jgi:hypothetical protein
MTCILFTPSGKRRRITSAPLFCSCGSPPSPAYHHTAKTIHRINIGGDALSLGRAREKSIPYLFTNATPTSGRRSTLALCFRLRAWRLPSAPPAVDVPPMTPSSTSRQATYYFLDAPFPPMLLPFSQLTTLVSPSSLDRLSCLVRHLHPSRAL